MHDRVFQKTGLFGVINIEPKFEGKFGREGHIETRAYIKQFPLKVNPIMQIGTCLYL
jgi:hypothetical protein